MTINEEQIDSMEDERRDVEKLVSQLIKTDRDKFDRWLKVFDELQKAGLANLHCYTLKTALEGELNGTNKDHELLTT